MPHCFAGPGDDVYLRDTANPGQRKKQILWGDFLNVVDEQGDLLIVTWGRDANGDPQRYAVRREDTQAERVLDVVFVDVGQGDGCVLSLPEADGQGDKLMLVDAGQGDNMRRFLRWRFGHFQRDLHFHAAVITHPDQDHYLGFQELFEEQALHFDHVFHNGIGERGGAERFGPLDAQRRFLIDPVVSHAEAQALYGAGLDHGRMFYPRLMRTALQGGRVGTIEMLGTASGVQEDGRAWLPGFAPSQHPELTVEVLGPVVQPDAQNRPRLRTFGQTITSQAMDEGKTKNGHSVLLRLRYREFTLLLGGDLNRPAEDFLLRHYAGIGPQPPLAQAVAAARDRFAADVMKSCHHGATDVTDEFLQAVQPFAFVVSSGDEESHVHPRPDLLGRLGRFGRGAAPLLLSTELLRSTREAEDRSLLEQVNRLNTRIEAAAARGEAADDDKATRAGLLAKLARRNVEVYGAITLRTDGRRLLIAFLMERPRGLKRWQTYAFRQAGAAGFVPD